MDFDFKHALKTAFAFVGLGLLLYQAAAAFYRGAPLRMIVNPYRRQWLVAGTSLATVAYGAMAFSADNKWDPPSIVAHLSLEFEDGKMPPREVAGLLFLLIGLALLGSVVFCWWVYPRDPKSFDMGRQVPDAAAKQVRRALHHYTTRRGGLEYAAVIVLPPAGTVPPTVEELLASRTSSGADGPPYRLLEWLSEGELKDIRRKRHLGPADRLTFESDRATWLSLALAAHPRAREQAVPCLQSNLGDVTLLQTRTRFGGLLFEYLYPAKENEPDFILFGVTMNAGEREGNRFYEHFAMLRRAVRYLLPDKYALGPALFPTELAVNAAPPPMAPADPPAVEPAPLAAAAAEPETAEATGATVAPPLEEENPETANEALADPAPVSEPVGQV